MTTIGLNLGTDQLFLTRGRDFKWSFRNVDLDDAPLDFPLGSLFIEFETDPVTTWYFGIQGSMANLSITFDQVNLIEAHTKWQLVFQPPGQLDGGEAIARGIVTIQT